MKVLTVRQPWAWAIVHAGKVIENRTWLTHYRGLIAIHAGTSWSARGRNSTLIREAFMAVRHPPGRIFQRGVIIGVADLLDAHWAEPGCCYSPWAEYEVYKEDERRDGRVSHFVLANRRPVEPVPWRGALNLRPIPDDIAARLIDA
jgi:hypothetical protein